MKRLLLPLLILCAASPAFAITPIYGHKVSQNLLPQKEDQSREARRERMLEGQPDTNQIAEPAKKPLTSWDPEATPLRKDENLATHELRRGAEPIKQPWYDGTGLGLAQP